MPGSGPRRHDARHRLIAPLARCRTLLPPLHRCCPGDAERAGNAGDHTKLTPSTAAATTKSRPPSSVLPRQPRPAQPRPKPPPNQIPIDGNPPNQPPRVPSWGAFGRRPQHRWIGHDRPASETLHRPCPSSLSSRTAGSGSGSGRWSDLADPPSQGVTVEANPVLLFRNGQPGAVADGDGVATIAHLLTRGAAAGVYLLERLPGQLSSNRPAPHGT